MNKTLKNYMIRSLDEGNKNFSESKNFSFFMENYGNKKDGFDGGRGSGFSKEKTQSWRPTTKGEDILLGDTDDIGKLGAQGLYLGGAGLSLISPSLARLMKGGGLAFARKFAPRSFARNVAKGAGTAMLTNLGDSILGQLQQLTGFDFVNANLGQMAKRNIENVMGGSGKIKLVHPQRKTSLSQNS